MADEHKDDGPGRPISGFELFRLPEFQALCDRLGIAWRLPTRSLTVRVPVYPEDVVRIEHNYLTGGEKLPTAEAVGGGGPVGMIDTTTQHNEKFRTMIPSAFAPANQKLPPDDVPPGPRMTVDDVPLETQLRWYGRIDAWHKRRKHRTAEAA